MRLQRREIKKARIEIIPMIDTIFFLLVFFMLASLSTTPMPAKKVRLPESATATARPKDKVVVTVDEQNRYFVDRAPVPFGGILPLLKQAVAANPRVTIILNADKEDQVGQLLKLMDVARQANPGQLVMATTPQTGGGGS